MPYIGQEAATTYSTRLAVQQFNGDGSTTAFTLNQSVSADQDILVSVDGVVQDTSAYTVSNGTTLTFSPAPSSGTANIFVNYLGLAVGTVTHPATQGLTATTGTFSSGIAADLTFLEGADIITASAGTSNFRAGVNAGNSIASGGNYNTVVGDEAGTAITTGDNNVLLGYATGTAITTGTKNIAIGANALDANTTGFHNVAIGQSALGAFNVTDSSNTYNTAVGAHAGKVLTTGTLNTIIGALAGDALTVGNSNTAVGQNALSLDTQGDLNTAIGIGALQSQNFTSTTDSYNTAVGGFAGGSNTTGQNNTFVGGLAGNKNTTADNNTAVGYHAGTAITTGDTNSAFGKDALVTCTTGTNNSAIGSRALNDLTSASNNAALGDLAGENITTGANNTTIGVSCNAITTTGENVTMVGHLCRASGATVSNEVVIGSNGMIGKGASTAFISGGNGPVYAGNNASSFSTTSDRRIKKNIVDNNVGLDAINKIQVRNFEYRTPDEIEELSSDCAIFQEGVQVGAIAQEMQKVLPECVTQESTGAYTVQQEPMVWALVNAIQELSEKVAALEAK